MLSLTKHSLANLIWAAACLSVAPAAHSSLIINPNGTVTQFRNDGSVLQWAQDANLARTLGVDPDGLMTWDQAVAWADQLVYAGHDDWRLPQILPSNSVAYNYSFALDGSTDIGYGVTSPQSELSYMYTVELGNSLTTVISTFNGGPFINLDAGRPLWSGTADPSNSNQAFYMYFNGGDQNLSVKTGELIAWVVRDANAVPEPSSLLLAAGALALASGSLRARKRRSAHHFTRL